MKTKDMSTIEALIENETAKKEKLLKRRAALDGKIKICSDNLATYQMMKNNQQFNALSDALHGKGVKFNDIINAISAGDFLSLQEKLEQTQTAPTTAETSNAKTDDTTEENS